MANSLNDLVKIEIDINAPVVDGASFDNILIFGAPPLTPTVANIPSVGTYNALTEVTDLGYVVTGDSADPVGIAARKWFSNSSSPVVISVQQPVQGLAADFTAKVITAQNAATEAVPIGTYDGTEGTYPWLQFTYNRQACDSADVIITKDGVVVYGAELAVTENPNAFLQVAFTGGEGDSDKMDLDPANYLNLTHKS